MPMYFGWFLLQQMTLAAMYSWWLMPLVSKGVRFEISPPLPFCEAFRHGIANETSLECLARV